MIDLNRKISIRTARVLAVLLGVLTLLAVLLIDAGQSHAVTPSEDACHTTNNATPLGNCGKFVQVYRETFNAQNFAVGTMSGCGITGQYRCWGLRNTRYYTTLGAYPTGWPDTAASGADGNAGPVPGYYHPESTVSVYRTAQGDGRMRVKMTSDGAQNRVAAIVPLRCQNLRYGKFTERFIVRNLSDRFKMAHLRYTPNEVDYPEAGSNFASDPIYAYTHGFRESSAYAAPNRSWTGWHTYSTEIVPGQVRFYFDGRKVATVMADFPDAAEWVLQNESALGIDRVSGPTSVTIDTTGLTCYKYQP